MTRMSIRELVESWRPRYLRASQKEKSRILEEFVAVTLYHRKSAIRLLRHGYRSSHLDRRGRPRLYTPDVKTALLEVWEACGKLLQVPGPVSPRDRGRAQARRHSRSGRRPSASLCDSRATIDRLLRTHRLRPAKRRGTTKPGTLQRKIPVRTFADWDGARPGYLEVDLVANFGESAKGEYLHTLAAVDVAERCELEVLPNRGPKAKRGGGSDPGGPAISPFWDRLRKRAFINANLLRYCQKEGITFCRFRPLKNDQAYVEKCWKA